jgi:hypothetical protein
MSILSVYRANSCRRIPRLLAEIYGITYTTDGAEEFNSPDQHNM